jgi:hypothetical protein
MPRIADQICLLLINWKLRNDEMSSLLQMMINSNNRWVDIQNLIWLYLGGRQKHRAIVDRRVRRETQLRLSADPINQVSWRNCFGSTDAKDLQMWSANILHILLHPQIWEIIVLASYCKSLIAYSLIASVDTIYLVRRRKSFRGFYFEEILLGTWISLRHSLHINVPVCFLS